MIIGTAGHIDHGKTSLVKALTGIDADRLKEEKARGITIDLGFAYWPQDDGTAIGFVDVPGHERFVHTMMAGAQGVDLVMLVIAADDGVMPQTREHLEIIELLGPREGLVVLTKIDVVSPERLLAVQNDVAMALSETMLADCPLFPVSNLTGDGLPALKDWLRAQHQAHVPVSDARLFRLAIDRSFVLQGAGVVVTGTVLDGTVRVGDEVIVSPSGLSARIRSIHAQNRKSETGRAGDRCALNLVGSDITKEAVLRGDMVLAAAAHAPSQRIDAEIKVAQGAPKGLAQWMATRLHHGTAEVGARIVLLEDQVPLPNEMARIQLVLDKPIAAFTLDRFVLRDPSASRTLAGGRFLDLRAPDRKRRAPERSAILAALANPALGQAFAALIEASPGPVSLDDFARDHGVDRSLVLDMCRNAGAAVLHAGKGLFALSHSRYFGLETAVRAHLTAFHAANPDLMGTGLERLRLQTAPRVPAVLFRLALRGFVEAGWLAIDGNWIRLASHSIEMSLEDENLWYEIRPSLDGTDRFRPPRVRDIASTTQEDENAIRRLLRRCARAGSVDEVAQDHFFLRTSVSELVTLAAGLEVDREGWFTAASFRDRLESASGGVVGRKVAIQILEFLDRHGVTIRRGDNRRINPHRRDLFEPAREAIAETAGNADNKAVGRESSLVGRPDFKSGWGREPVPGGFDSHSLPPHSAGEQKHVRRPA